MDCSSYRSLLSAWVDRELEAPDRARLEEHLAACPDCRGAAESLRELHADLGRAFQAPRAAAARVAEQTVVALSAGPPLERRTIGRDRPGWTMVAAAAALGFVLALVIFPPGKGRQIAGDARNPAQNSATSRETPAATSVAWLVTSTALEGVEYADETAKDWRAAATLAQFRCPAEGSVRTDDATRCELMTSDGCVVRMNAATEISFPSAGRIELRRGEIWCRSTPQAPLEVVRASADTPAAAATADSALFCCTASDATCVLKVAGSGEQLLVTAAAGNVSVQARDEKLQLAPSETATLTRDRVARDRSSDRLLATAWIQPLLIRKGHADPELTERVDELLARLGESKVSSLYETEIRSLGEYGVLPLLQYVQSPRSSASSRRRLVAMRIVSDLAPAWAIDDLVGLLSDTDPDVRSLSAAALERLTRQTQGVAPEVWRGEAAGWEPAATAWQTWWAGNRGRYPPRLEAAPSRSL